jgi:hypothetical protein
MLHDNAIELQFDPPDPDVTYAHYLETCQRAGINPVSWERAQDLIAEWTEVPSGRPEPPQR